MYAEGTIDPLFENPKYEKIRDLATGSFGSVKHARNKFTGEEVAIKFIYIGNRFLQKYVEREINNHRMLIHPHIVAFKEIFLSRQYLAIVMEYVGGGNLQHYVERAGRLPEWQARCFFQQLILALNYSHSLHIAHRDVKLGNILLNTKFQIPILKVCDFGYSKNMAYGSLPKTRVGTAAYISPEVARTVGDAYDTEKADVWSCGVTLYCMLAGRYPFLDVDQQVRLQYIQNLTQADVTEALSKLVGISDECVSLMRGLLDINPASRPSLAQIMADPWFTQFLPDLSSLQLIPQRDVQSVEDIHAVLAQAEHISKEWAATHAIDEDALAEYSGMGSDVISGMSDSVMDGDALSR